MAVVGIVWGGDDQRVKGTADAFMYIHGDSQCQTQDDGDTETDEGNGHGSRQVDHEQRVHAVPITSG